MVEFQDDGIALSAIGTAVLFEVLDNEAHSVENDALATGPGVVDVSLTILGVMLLLVSGPAGSAVVVPLPFLYSAPSKFLERLMNPASSAPPCHGTTVGMG